MSISKDSMDALIKAQQGELDGVETYLCLAEAVHNQTDAETFRKLAADEGRHASVFKKYTDRVLVPKKGQANAVVILYRLLGKRVIYPLIAQGEYTAINGYEHMMAEFPEVETVKNDEKRHGDTVKALLKNGEYNDLPLMPLIGCGIAALALLYRVIRRDVFYYLKKLIFR